MTQTWGPPQTPVLANIMSRRIVSVPVLATLGEAATRMERLGVGSVLVMEGARAAGIVTEHDITRALGDGRPAGDSVAAVMTRDIVSRPATTPVHEALRVLLGRGIRHLVVTGEAGEPIGIVSDTDLRYTDGLDLLADPVDVGRVMDRDPPCLGETDSVRTAARALRSASVRHVLVLDADRIVRGVVSERDMVHLFRKGCFDAPVGRIMSQPPVTISATADLVEAATLMRARHVRMLVVVDADGRLDGVVHEKHLVRRIEDAYVDLLHRLVSEQARALGQIGIGNLVEEMPQGLALKDLDLVYRSVNAALAAEIGRPRDEILGARDGDLLPPERAAAETAADRAALAAGGVTVVEEEVPWGEGHRWYRVTRRPVPGPDGGIEALLVLRDDITAMRDASEALRRRNWALAALNRADRAIVQAEDEQALLQAVCAAITHEDEYPLCWIGWAEDDAAGTVRIVAADGLEQAYVRDLRITWRDGPEGKGPTGMSIRSGRSVVNNHAAASQQFRTWRARAQTFGLGASLSVPLVGRTGTLGSLAVYSRSEEGFGPQEVELFEEFARNLVFGIESRRTRVAYEASAAALAAQEATLRKALTDALAAMAGMLEQRDPYTAGHQKQVARLAVAIGREMGLSPDRLEALNLAAIVHDIGKIEVPVEILTKPARLSRAEFALIKHHPEVGYQLLSRIDFPWPIADIIRQHHEYLDGSGYPRGLKGDEILTEARILTVADIVDSISSDRPYRPALGVEAAIEEIIRLKGIRLDPAVVDACLAVLARTRLEPHRMDIG